MTTIIDRPGWTAENHDFGTGTLAGYCTQPRLGLVWQGRMRESLWWMDAYYLCLFETSLMLIISDDRQSSSGGCAGL